MKNKEEFYESGSGIYKYNGYVQIGDYMRLLDIARENNIFSFDINDAITYIIRNFPRKTE